MTREQMKSKALELMYTMHVDEGAIQLLEFYGSVSLFEFGKCHTKNHHNLRTLRDMKERFEHAYGFYVYGIVHGFISGYEMYSFLFVSKFKEDWSVSYRTDGKHHFVYAYVWNVDDNSLSEIGSVSLISENGVLRRVG